MALIHIRSDSHRLMPEASCPATCGRHL